jgi:hypothetical protein
MTIQQEAKSASLEAYREHDTREEAPNLAARREQVEQTRRRQRTVRALARPSADAYVEFLDSLFSYYRESARVTEIGTREG